MAADLTRNQINAWLVSLVDKFVSDLADSPKIRDKCIEQISKLCAMALRTEAAERKLATCLEQATEGVFAEHECPAMFACAAIIAELKPEEEKT